MRERQEARNHMAPAPIIETVKEIEKNAGEEMQDKIKDAVKANKDKLDADIKKQEDKAKQAKIKSNLPVAPSGKGGKGEGMEGWTADEIWTSDLPKDLHQKKVTKSDVSIAKK